MFVTFPLRIHNRLLRDPPALAGAVRDDALSRDPATPRPREWVPALIASGDLPEDMAVALAAALLQDSQPAVLVESAHLARALGRRELGQVLIAALDAHDVGVLLVAAPGEAQGSVEDVLLLAATELADLSDASVRSSLLERLRLAGLAEVELDVLSRAGSPAEVRTWLPAILSESLPNGASLVHLLRRAETREDTVRTLEALDAESKQAAWDLAREADPLVAGDARLRWALLGGPGSEAASKNS